MGASPSLEARTRKELPFPAHQAGWGGGRMLSGKRAVWVSLPPGWVEGC